MSDTTPSPKGTRQPALDHLNALVGEWETEATHPALPNTVVRGRATFEWLDGGYFLIWRAAYDHPDIPNGIAIMGCDASGDADPSSAGCTLRYFDSRGVSRVYQLSADKSVWRFWRDAPWGFAQRFTGTFSADGNTITGSSDISEDGSTWALDLQITYKRVR
jgi:hypothetical protein